MPFSNQTSPKESHEPCKCKCRLDSGVCINKKKMEWRYM